MNHIKAVGFDLFNTLIIADTPTLGEAMSRLTRSLQESGLDLDHKPFRQAHREAAMGFIEEARRNGKETHNRFWISAALNTFGLNIPPDDPRIGTAVEAYFSAFYENCHTIPGTLDMLERLREKYPLGLLSNFTHAPAAIRIIERVGIRPFFDVVLISGELGYRKPHPIVFQNLIERLGVEKNQILYIGDDPEPDIVGAREAGLQPVWMTYVQDKNIPPTPGVLSRGNEKPDFDVPRISIWDDLFDYLEKI